MTRAPHYTDGDVTLYHGDALEVARELPDGTVDCIVTSPPYYGLRDYGAEGQYGLEDSPAEYVDTMRSLFAELRRVLADDGTLWLNLGDSYASGSRTTYADTGKSTGRIAKARPPSEVPGKNLLGIPWRVAFALQDDGWILRNAIIWHKPNAMPESVTDRLANRYEHVFMFSKSRHYWFDLDAVRVEYTGDRTPSRTAHNGANKPNTIATPWREPAPESPTSGRNPGDVWVVPTQPFTAAHFAVMPLALAQHCVLAGCRAGRTVLDPFSGSGTTGAAAQLTGRNYVGIDINAEYLDMSLNHPKRLRDATFALG